MKLDLDFDLPVSVDSPEPDERMSSAQYLEFVEFNQQIMRENGTAEKLLRQRACPVEALFEMAD